MTSPDRRPEPSRRGLAEYVVLIAVLAALAAAAGVLFGDQIRGAFGLRPAQGRAAPPAGGAAQ